MYLMKANRKECNASTASLFNCTFVRLRVILLINKKMRAHNICTTQYNARTIFTSLTNPIRLQYLL